MRSVPAFLAVLVFATATTWAQFPGPNIQSVVGSADFSSAATVGIPQGSIFTVTGGNLATGIAVLTGPTLPTIDLKEFEPAHFGYQVTRSPVQHDLSEHPLPETGPSPSRFHPDTASLAIHLG